MAQPDPAHSACRSCGKPRDLAYLLMCGECVRAGVPIPPVDLVDDLESIGDSEGMWTRERIEQVWDSFARDGFVPDRRSVHFNNHPDGEFCKEQRRFLADALDRAGLAPASGKASSSSPGAQAARRG